MGYDPGRIATDELGKEFEEKDYLNDTPSGKGDEPGEHPKELFPTPAQDPKKNQEPDYER